MEEIQISEGKINEVMAGLSKLKSVGIVFIVFGLLGLIPIGSILLGIFGSNASFAFTTPPTMGFAGVGIIFLSQALFRPSRAACTSESCPRR